MHVFLISFVAEDIKKWRNVFTKHSYKKKCNMKICITVCDANSENDAAIAVAI